MSINTFFTHHCEAWEPQDFVPPDSPSPYQEFLIEIYANLRYLSMDGEEYSSINIIRPTTMKAFREGRDELMDSSTSWLIISNMLSQMSVPYNVQVFMIPQISQRASEIANHPQNKNRKTIAMIVSLQVIEECIQFMDAHHHHLHPHLFRTEASIETLEKVRVKNFAIQCVICLEEISVGSEASQTPCEHLYHQECIVNWLERSNLCPLCRFQMPAC